MERMIFLCMKTTPIILFIIFLEVSIVTNGFTMNKP